MAFQFLRYKKHIIDGAAMNEPEKINTTNCSSMEALGFKAVNTPPTKNPKPKSVPVSEITCKMNFNIIMSKISFYSFI